MPKEHEIRNQRRKITFFEKLKDALPHAFAVFSIAFVGNGPALADLKAITETVIIAAAPETAERIGILEVVPFDDFVRDTIDEQSMDTITVLEEKLKEKGEREIERAQAVSNQKFTDTPLDADTLAKIRAELDAIVDEIGLRMYGAEDRLSEVRQAQYRAYLLMLAGIYSRFGLLPQS